MENATTDISNELAASIISTIHQKNILLIYQKDAIMPELKYCLVAKLLKKHKAPLGWICWGETAEMVKKGLVNFDCQINFTTIIDTVSNLADDDCTVICAPTDFSSIMRNVHKLMKNEEQVLVLDNPDKTGIQNNSTAYLKFQSVLLNNKKADATIITSIESNLLDPKTQKSLSSQYDIILHINKDTIQFKGTTEKKQIAYSIKDNKLTLEPSFISKTSKIINIFDISQDEKITLNKIVEKQIDAHKDMLR